MSPKPAPLQVNLVVDVTNVVQTAIGYGPAVVSTDMFGGILVDAESGQVDGMKDSIDYMNLSHFTFVGGSITETGYYDGAASGSIPMDDAGGDFDAWLSEPQSQWNYFFDLSYPDLINPTVLADQPEIIGFTEAMSIANSAHCSIEVVVPVDRYSNQWGELSQAEASASLDRAYDDTFNFLENLFVEGTYGRPVEPPTISFGVEGLVWTTQYPGEVLAPGQKFDPQAVADGIGQYVDVTRSMLDAAADFRAENPTADFKVGIQVPFMGDQPGDADPFNVFLEDLSHLSIGELAQIDVIRFHSLDKSMDQSGNIENWFCDELKAYVDLVNSARTEMGINTPVQLSCDAWSTNGTIDNSSFSPKQSLESASASISMISSLVELGCDYASAWGVAIDYSETVQASYYDEQLGMTVYTPRGEAMRQMSEVLPGMTLLSTPYIDATGSGPANIQAYTDSSKVVLFVSANDIPDGDSNDKSSAGADITVSLDGLTSSISYAWVETINCETSDGGPAIVWNPLDGTAATGACAINYTNNSVTIHVDSDYEIVRVIVVTSNSGIAPLYLVGDSQANTGVINDSLSGGQGSDYIQGLSGADSLHGGSGNDSLYGDRSYSNGVDSGDSIWGDGGNDTVYGGGGNDQIYGGSGNDVVHGDAGDDRIHFSDGKDALYGDAGIDTLIIDYAGGVSLNTNPGTSGRLQITTSGFESISGGAGNDYLLGGTAPTSISGNGGADTIIGSFGTDSFHGDDGNDSISGGDGNDTIYGGQGNDTVRGGNGNDKVYFEGGVDALFGDAGKDTLLVDYAGGVNINTSAGPSGHPSISVTGFESISGGSGSDYIVGSTSPMTISGNNGADSIFGSNGSDSLFGDDGNDLIFGGNANDTIYGGQGNDTLHGDAGNDAIHFIGGADNLFGDAGTDTLIIDFTGGVSINASDGASGRLAVSAIGFEKIIGGSGSDYIVGSTNPMTISGNAGNDSIWGSNGNDSLTGDGGNDLIFGGGANDTIYGGPGNDTLHGGDGNDAFHYSAGVDVFFGDAGSDTLFVDYAGGVYINSPLGGAGHPAISISGIESISGGTGCDYIVGGDAVTSISGNDGADTILGLNGKEILFGDAGSDVLSGSGGNDTLYGGNGSDFVSGGPGVDMLFGGLGADEFNFSIGDFGDFILDFDLAGDRDHISITQDAIGSVLETGIVLFCNFIVADDNRALDENDFFIFRSSDSTLWFDEDGSGEKSAILVATLSGFNGTLCASDLMIV